MNKIDRFFIGKAAGNRASDEFREELHPRAENGQFTSGGGSNAGNGAQIEAIKAQMSKLSRFGEEGKKRSSLQAQIRALQGEPEKKPQKPTTKTVEQSRTAEKGFHVTERKQKQFEVVQKANPMSDDYHVGIRKPSDIRTPEEAFLVSEDEYVYPDFTKADGEKAVKEGKIRIYSSKPIKNGGFVSPSKRMAGDYAGGGKVYEMEVPIDSVAWINAGEGQFAQV